MARFRITAEARADLEAIHDYIAENDPGRAKSFIEALAARFRLLAENPAAGPRRPEIHPDLRVHAYRRYVICYREADGGVDVVRVFHGSRLWSRLLEG